MRQVETRNFCNKMSATILPHGRHLTRNCVTATAKTLKFSVSVCFPRCPHTAFSGTGYQIISFTAVMFTTFKKNFCLHSKGSVNVLFHLWHWFLHRRDLVVPRLPTDIHEFLEYDLRLKPFIILQLTGELIATLSAMRPVHLMRCFALLSPYKFKGFVSGFSCSL